MDISKPSIHAFDDVDYLRSSIYDNVKNAYASAYPITNSQYKLELADVGYDDPTEVSPITAQRKAILTGKSLTRPLHGTWRLSNVADNSVVEQRRAKIADIPQMTQRGTFIYRGNEYTLSHQARLLPGVYTRKKENGELESHFNIMPGSGPSFRVFMEPETGVFDVKVGQSKFALYPLLRGLGVSDKELSTIWGRDLLAANATQANKPSIAKAYEKFTDYAIRKEFGDKLDDEKSKPTAIAKAMAAMKLDPNITEETLGTRFDTVSPQAILAATHKLLKIRKGEMDTDDRDNISYQKVIGPAEMLAERIKADVGGVARRALWKATYARSLNPILNHQQRNKQLESVLLSSGLGMPLEESNPLDIYDQLQRVSRLGYGGIPDTDAIPDESRAVQPSYMGFIDVVRTAESEKAGVDNRTAYNVHRGSDGKLYSQFLDKTGKKIFVPSTDATRSVIAFPGELKKAIAENRPAQALVRGRIKYVDPSKVDYELPHPEHMMSTLAHLVPFLSSIKGHRTNMVARMATQALAIKDGEAPFVQTSRPSGEPNDSFERFLGSKTGIVRSDAAGMVTKLDKDSISIKTPNGIKRYELYDNFPYNRRGFVNNTPMVKPGDYVKPGQLLAKTNFTNDEGELALGKNLRTAYLPFKGLTVEDAIVVSESAAKKMASEHMYQHSMDIEPGQKVSRNAFISAFPTTYNKAQLANFTDNGLIKPGTVVKKGDPLILSISEKSAKGQGVLTRSSKARFMDSSHVWEYDDDGIVTDVHAGPKDVNVIVKAYRPCVVGDKLTMRFGGKGVISSIVPDDQMPHDSDKNPLELLIHPFGTISRSNPAAILELALGKVAAKLGKKYVVPSFQDGSNLKTVQDELKKYGIKDTETLFDPNRNANVNNVLSGVQYWMKLHHTAEDKADARADDGSYTIDKVPAKGGEGSAKRIGGLETMSLLSAGATEVLRDAKLIRGQRNDDFWRAFRLGYPPPTPEAPFVYKKFMDDLRSAGINVSKTGNFVNIMALTDKDIDKMSRGEVKSDDTLDFDTMKPISGGLFDIGLTGGPEGTGFTHVNLNHPLPNPVFEDSIRKVLGLTEGQLEDVIAGKRMLKEKTGPEALRSALQSLNVHSEIDRLKDLVTNGSKTNRDDAIKRLRVFTMLKKTGIKPEELMLTKVPIMPPQYRPIATGPKGMTIVSDPNYLYKEIIRANNNVKDVTDTLGHEAAGDERLALYNSFKALVGLSDPLQPKLQEKNIKGILSHALGLRSSPKFSVFQRKIIGSTTDMVGSAVITPNPSLDMDQVGLPEEKAWTLYRPFIIRSLVRRGTPAVQAVNMVANKDRIAKDALIEEMKVRPVLINRAPTLHKFGIMAAWPVLAKTQTMQLSPTIVSGYGADFDGDRMQFHVPVSDEAISEAKRKLMPSANLLSARNFDVHYAPIQEFLHGLFRATHDQSAHEAKTFATKADAIAAFRRGEINADTRIKILHG